MNRVVQCLYIGDLRKRLCKLEKSFEYVSALADSTQRSLSRARDSLAFHQNILDGVGYIQGIDTEEIGASIKVSRVGLRHYELRVVRLERHLDDYTSFKSKVENEWKQINSELTRSSSLVEISAMII